MERLALLDNTVLLGAPWYKNVKILVFWCSLLLTAGRFPRARLSSARSERESATPGLSSPRILRFRSTTWQKAKSVEATKRKDTAG